MSPTIVLKRGEPVLSLGAAGGPTIISQTVVNLINLLDYQLSLDQALKGPRIHQQWKPNELRTEPLPAAVKDELMKRGHSVVEVRKAGAAQIVMKTEKGIEAAHDPRLDGKAAGW